MPQQMTSTAGEAVVTVPHTRVGDQPVPPDAESFNFVDVEHGDPDGADAEAAVASWDGFL